MPGRLKSLEYAVKENKAELAHLAKITEHSGRDKDAAKVTN